MIEKELKLTKRKLESQQEIIEAAAVCFMKYGLEKATIDHMARELGSTKGRVYHHFASKDEIFFAVYRQAMQFCFDAVLPIVSQPMPADQKLLAMAKAHGRVMMETLPFQRSIRQGVNSYLHGAQGADRDVLNALIARRNEYEDLYRAVLQQGIEDGTLSMPDVAIAGRAIMGALNSLVDWYRVRPEQNHADQLQIADTLAETAITGLLA
ncbi:TetR/AcrR family transcriptional regulator [Sulfitobacter guttiformis]|uniref:TetR family transcriptional regulator n=1 Tax=Sulfitobacter guttiformis TaxID=74349 RepID=A0A420DTH4_9RHOB|nr:TetR/AcrR family transcriptional regulator [Sulfitobacter guttiformis]KIN71104.1 TetR-family transcriptional regulator [Sulfitobacter guttiformis KCTC 32187]RKE97586.1 TetR family transcriptional regulator [Sulfitobacter guttiformis]